MKTATKSADTARSSAERSADQPIVQRAPARGLSNHGLTRLLGGARMQHKLTVSAPGDVYEQEAERVADRVMRAPVTTLRRACECGGSCDSCRKKQLIAEQVQTMPLSSEAGSGVAPDIVHEVISSPGRPLDPGSQDFFQSRFGHDLSGVRIHTDIKAGESAEAVGARAYTVGSNIVFGAGHFEPHTDRGQRLMAHELTHVLQQNGGSAIQRYPEPVLKRAPLVKNTMTICKRVLKGETKFKVSAGGVVVKAWADWHASDEWGGKEKPQCGRDRYNISLTKVGLWDSDIATCEFHMGKRMQRNYVNVPPGEYYLTISTNNTNPNCCLKGDVEVTEDSGLKTGTCGGGPERDVTGMPNSEKITVAMEKALDPQRMKGQGAERLRELIKPESLALMAAFGAVYAASQLTPIGWVADILVGVLVVATVAMVGREALDIVKLLMNFYKTATEAKTEADLDTAADFLAEAITKAGVDIVIAILFHKAGKAVDLKPSGPRSPGLGEVLKKGGGKLMAELNAPTAADMVTPDGQIIRVPVEKLPGMMSEAQPPGGKGGGQPSGAKTGKSAGGGPEAGGESPKNLPGKNTIAADAAAKKLLPEQPKDVAEPAKKETGAQQERRLLKEDKGPGGRGPNTKTYHSYEGGSSGSFRQWFSRVRDHVSSVLKGDPNAPKMNEAPLSENTHKFIDRHANLKAAWEKMTLKIDSRLQEIQRLRAEAKGEKGRIGELAKEENALTKRRDELAKFESGEVGAKRPDLVETFFDQKRAEVTDITQKTGDPLHNFKTEFYVELLKEITGWSDVRGVNYNTVYDMTFVE